MKVLGPHLPDLCDSMLATALFDREVNVRRAAAAALQVSTEYHGCWRVGSNLAGRIGPGRVRVTRPDPREYENLLTRPHLTRPDPTREISKTCRPDPQVRSCVTREETW